MRRKLVAGNWKMNLLRDEAQALVAEILGMLADEESRSVHVVLIPPYIHIAGLVQQTSGDKRIAIGAQNCSDKMSGAFTGEVSAAMLKSVGAGYVIVGHSERRAYFQETNQQLADKVNHSLSEKLIPIFCFGEVMEERKANNQEAIVKRQLEEGLFHLSADEIKNCVLAYEPVWAIGTGLTASPAQAQEMHHFVRSLISTKYSGALANEISILYGGSVTDQNAKELFALPDVDGGLIGGASLKSRNFVNIVKCLPY